MFNPEVPRSQKNTNQEKNKKVESEEGFDIKAILQKFKEQKVVITEKLKMLTERLKSRNSERGDEYTEVTDSLLRELGKSRALKTAVLLVSLLSPTVASGGPLDDVLKAVENTKQAEVNGAKLELKMPMETFIPTMSEEVSIAQKKMLENTLVNGHRVPETSPGVYEDENVKVTKIRTD